MISILTFWARLPSNYYTLNKIKVNTYVFPQHFGGAQFEILYKVWGLHGIFITNHYIGMGLRKSILKNKKMGRAVLAVAVFCLAIFLIPVTSAALGNLFFGKVPSLYNVTLAQFFFKQASNPLFGDAPQYTHYQLSRTYFIQGDFDNAIYYANKELDLYPENCRTHYIRGLTYGYMNDLDNAIEDFETFNTSCVKDSWAGHNDLAWFYFRKGDIAGMLRTMEKVVSKNETNPWVQNAYGIALLNLGRYEEAVIAFKKALTVANTMTEKDWGVAYPGNSPRIYERGLLNMRKTLQENLKVATEKMKS